MFLQLWQAGLERFDELEGIDWSCLSMDGAMTGCPLGAAPWGEKTVPNPTDRGKGSVKRRLLTESRGVPDAMKLVRSTIESIVVERPEPTDEQPQGMCLDKGYDDDDVREILAEFGFTAHIRSRGEEAKALAREAGKRARRWVVERSHSWMNRFRRILVRWEKKPQHDLAVLHFACGFLALCAAGFFG